MIPLTASTQSVSEMPAKLFQRETHRHTQTQTHSNIWFWKRCEADELDCGVMKISAAFRGSRKGTRKSSAYFQWFYDVFTYSRIFCHCARSSDKKTPAASSMKWWISPNGAIHKTKQYFFSLHFLSILILCFSEMNVFIACQNVL